MAPKWLSEELFSMGGYTLTFGQLLFFFIVCIGTLVVSSAVRSGLHRVSQRNRMISASQAYAIGRMLHYLLLAVGLMVALSVLGIDVSKLALVAGALGIGIGLGLQGIVNNFVSGIVILVEKSVKTGDFVELDPTLMGEVMEINMRATLIRTNDNVDILVPNAELIGGKVINWTLAESVRRFRIPFGVAYGSDKEAVRTAALEAAASVPFTLQDPGREPAVWMTGFGDSSLDFVLGVWVQPELVKRPTALNSAYYWALDDAFRKYKIEIPFPQRDLHLRSAKAPVRIENG